MQDEIEVVTTDLPPGIAAQYYVGLRQLVIADDLDADERNRVLASVADQMVQIA